MSSNQKDKKSKNTPKLPDEIIEYWANQDLWSESEFIDLCCDLEPNSGRQNTKELNAELNKARDQIHRAVFAKVLPCREPDDATPGDIIYGRNRYFKPADAIRWAEGRFPNFPKRFLKLLPPSEVDSEEVAENAVLQKPEIKDPAPQSNVYDVLRVLLEMTHNSRELESLQHGDKDAIEDLQSKLRLHRVDISTKSLRSYLRKAYKK